MINTVDELDAEKTLALCKIVGLLKILSGDLKASVVDHFDQFDMEYQEVTKYVLDQVALRRKEGTRQPLRQLAEDQGDKDDEGEWLRQFRDASDEDKMKMHQELLAFGSGTKVKGGGKGKGKSEYFEGDCDFCGKWGHRKRDCRVLDQEMAE